MEHYQIQIEEESESKEATMAFILANRNWDIEKKRFKKPEAENCQANIIECQIYWRGKYLIVQHKGIIHIWDSFPHCFLKQAVEFFQPELPAEWKTLDKLISFRQAIRQTEVNGCGYVDDMLEGNDLTQGLYDRFMELARAQDLDHHGSHTF